MPTSDLQALFANIRPTSQDPSPIPTSPPAPFSGVNPAHMPNSPPPQTAGAGQASSNNATAQSLLNLLNFGSTTQHSTSANPKASLEPASVSKPETTRTISASDLVARLMSPPTVETESRVQPLHVDANQDGGGGGPKPPNFADPSQDALLKLLSKAKSTQSSRPASAELSRSASQQQNGNSHDPAPAANVKNEGMASQENKPIFTYTNPFEALNASRQRTPKASALVPHPTQSPIFKNISDIPQPSVEIAAETAPTASARADRLARESSIKSTGLPEPTVKVETPGEEASLPIRSTKEHSPAISGPSEIKEEDVKQEEEMKESPQPGAEEWEDAEESPQDEWEPRRVPVYNFPIKPFVSINLQLPHPSEVGIRQDGVMEISRLKKDFDQLDRSLAAATTKYIAYSLVKNGGIRIIRQDDGSDRQVFKNSHDRIFNIAFCSTATNFPPSDAQAVLGTGISGIVYYATVSKDGNDLFEKNELESECLTFPPWPPADDNAAGGVLKTRAKRSSRHSDFFAIGRGKSIHLVWPATVMSPRYEVTDANRRVDMDKLYQERNLQIATGKAGKDFAFSEDDTLIVSLDKTGRLRFWDIRELTDEANATALKATPIKVDVPLLSLLTTSPTEKSWPTSVLFVDKVRPYTKGGALRYVLVGLRQNHSLQLWDIALGKAVQEVNFPHENEADGICSVNYHPGSGIIVVGHPTRNSLFFVHLSAPRYTLSSSITQAAYIQRIAAKDPDLPKPDSTACMSGIREMSFESKGQLRSVELLPVHKAPDAPKTTDVNAALFELYVVHSKGVTCLTINKEDLGWDLGSKVIHGIDAAKEGFLDLKELRIGTITEESTGSKSPVEEAPAPTTSTTKSKKKSKRIALAVDSNDATPVPEIPAVEPSESLVNGFTTPGEPAVRDENPHKESKKSKKTSALTEALTAPKAASRIKSPVPSSGQKTDSPEANAIQSSSRIIQPSVSSASEEDAQGKSERYSLGISGDWLDKEIKKIEQTVSREFKRELNHLLANLQQDRVVQDTSASARQEAVLRLVSQTLTNNVERTMANIVSTQMQQVVVPAVQSIIAQAIRDEIGGQVARTLHDLMPRELGMQLPATLKSALSSPQLSQTISGGVSAKIAKQVETQMNDVVKKQIVPTFERLSAAAAEQAATQSSSHIVAELQRHEAERRRDMARIEKIQSVMSDMAETLRTMTETQVAFQNRYLRDRQDVPQLGGTIPAQISTARISPSPALVARPIPVKAKTKQELELERIAELMEDGKYEEGSIKWLHSDQQVELFDHLFVRYTPDYLSTDVSPLVAFSIAVTVAKSLTKNVGARLEWVIAAFDAVDLHDSEIADLSEHAPALLTSLIQKLESLYMTTAEVNVNDPVLRQILSTAKRAREMRSALGGGGGLEAVAGYPQISAL